MPGPRRGRAGAASAVLLALLVLGAAPGRSPGAEAGSIRHPPAWARRAGRVALPHTVLVEFHGLPRALGGVLEHVLGERHAVLHQLQRLGLNFHVRHTYGSLFNGVALRLDDPADIAAVAAVDGVASVFHSYTVPSPMTGAVQHPGGAAAWAEQGRSMLSQQANASLPAKEDSVHDMTNVTQVHQQLGLTGQGIRIGIIDTGIDYTHPAFGACERIGPGCRVAFGFDFAGDAYNPGSPDPRARVPRPDENPMDCAGHGTHVAGIAAGNDTRFTGVAPDATLGAYKVFGCEGGTSDELILAAMEMAYEDAMDVINLSLGGGSSWPQAPTSRAADVFAQKGVQVVAAMGNSGALGLWQASDPAVARRAVAVASFDNAVVDSPVFEVSPGGQQVAYNRANAPSNATFEDGDLAVSSADTNATDDGCTPYSQSFAGQVLLMRRGTCTFAVKALNAQAAGATSAIIYNREPGSLSGGINSTDVKIPVAFITEEDGVALVQLAGAQTVGIKWLEKKVLMKNPTGGQISSFSSWGLGPDLSIKPDIGAPGGMIFSAWPLAGETEGGEPGYNTISGTSMASPYIAGVAALLVQSRDGEKVSDGELTRVLQNNAVPAALLGAEGVQTPVVRQGAGLVNALQAIQGETSVNPPVIQLFWTPILPEGLKERVVGSGGAVGRAVNNTIFRAITVRNTGNSFVQYRLSHVPAASVNGTNTSVPALVDAPAHVDIQPATLFLPPKVLFPVLLSITPNESIPDDESWLYSGYIKIEPVSKTSLLGFGGSDSEDSYSTVYVPYSGFKGRYRETQIFHPEGQEGAPLVTSNPPGQGEVYRFPNETAVFTFRRGDVPVFVADIAHPTPLLTAQLYEYNTDKLMGYVDYVPYVGNALYATAWASPAGLPGVMEDPVRAPGVWTEIPGGTYYVQVSAEAPLGNPLVTNDNSFWQSPRMVFQTRKSGQ